MAEVRIVAMFDAEEAHAEQVLDVITIACSGMYMSVIDSPEWLADFGGPQVVEDEADRWIVGQLMNDLDGREPDPLEPETFRAREVLESLRRAVREYLAATRTRELAAAEA